MAQCTGGVARAKMAATTTVLKPTSTTELVRSNQKDRLYSGYLTALLSDIINPYIPQRYWLKWQREIQLTGELLYYGFTTIIGNQTLGEEYTNTIQVVDRSTNTGPRYIVPGGPRRTLAILLQIFGRYLLEKFLNMLRVMMDSRQLPFNLSPLQYNIVQWCTANMDDAISTVNQLHLSLFYLRGLYYTIGKRIMGIHYLVVQYERMATPTNPYKLLGLLLLLQVIYKLIKGIIAFLNISRDPVEDESSIPHYSISNDSIGNCEQTVSKTLKCALCLEACRVPTATPCGHVMCWECSTEWVRDKQECPLCRTTIEPQQLVPLQHYEKQ